MKTPKSMTSSKTHNAIIVMGVLIVIVLIPLVVLDIAGRSRSKTPQMQPNNISSANDTFVKIDEFQRSKHPEVFLANRVPYQTESYAISSTFIPGDPLGYFQFTVTLKNAQGKTDFLDWLKSLKLTDEQIQTLNITYR